ncbi:MAG: hypothetical protein KDD61_17550, partial [Bdellovibrionales bacterium]|nr:hypothetical protein [Bdellovibrionales bacterium]
MTNSFFALILLFLWTLLSCSTAYKKSGFRDNSSASYCKKLSVGKQTHSKYEKIIIDQKEYQLVVEPLTTIGTTFFGPIFLPLIPIRLGDSKEIELATTINFKITPLKQKIAPLDISKMKIISGEEVAVPISSTSLLIDSSGKYFLKFKFVSSIKDQITLVFNDSKIILEKDSG